MTKRIEHKVTAEYFDIFLQKILNIISTSSDYNITVLRALIALFNLTDGLHVSNLHPGVVIISIIVILLDKCAIVKVIPSTRVFNQIFQNFNRRLHSGHQVKCPVSEQTFPRKIEIKLDFLLFLSIPGISIFFTLLAFLKIKFNITFKMKRAICTIIFLE